MMSQHPARDGGCLCGAVRFTAEPSRLEMDVCHCSMCRRWSGGVFMAVPCASFMPTEGAAELAVFSSSSHGERLFCCNCGSSVAWRMSDGSMIAVSMQAFDDKSGFVFAEEIFVDDKPPHYSFANQTRKLTGAEVMAQFANPEGA